MKGSSSRDEAERLRRMYPPGTRIVLDKMADDPDPLPPGSTGKVFDVDDAGEIMVCWDCGRDLSLLPGIDRFHSIQQKPDAIMKLREKIELNYAEYREIWENRSPEKLIGMADLICAVQLAKAHLMEAVTEEQAEYLLRFCNPLEVVSETFHETHLADDVFLQEEFGIIAEQIMDSVDVEQIYEMEPDMQIS